MPNSKPVITLLTEANALERDFGLLLLHHLHECGYDILGPTYWKERIKERQLRERVKQQETTTSERAVSSGT